MVGGDFSADVAANSHTDWPRVVGRNGSLRTSQGGRDLLSWCTRNGMLVMDTFFDQPLNKRFTWWHPAHGTGHIIDHFLTKGNCFRFIDNARTVHAGRRGNAGEPLGRSGRGHRGRAGRRGAPGGSVHWDDFTDHLPVEMHCHFWPTQDRTTSRPENGAENIVLPQVEKLAVPGREAKELRKKWHELLQARIRDTKANKGYLGWEDLTTMCLETSKEVLGPRRAAGRRPHLKGHEAENTQLDMDVAKALTRVRDFREDTLPRDANRQQELLQAQQHSRQVRKRRRKTRLRWKWEWVDRVTESLNQANQRGSTKEVYRLVKLLGVRHEVSTLRGFQATVADPEQEREEWKEHFRKLQEGREIAQETVWQTKCSQGG